VFLSACGEKTPAKTGAGTGTSATKDLTGTLNFVNF
jgi:hypothetical protein